MNIGNSSLGEESGDTRATAVEQCHAAGMSFMVAEIASACLNPIIWFWFLMFTYNLLTISTHSKTNKQTKTRGIPKSKVNACYISWQIIFFVFQLHNV